VTFPHHYHMGVPAFGQLSLHIQRQEYLLPINHLLGGFWTKSDLGLSLQQVAWGQA
jgi:hypothetical protein